MYDCVYVWSGVRNLETPKNHLESYSCEYSQTPICFGDYVERNESKFNNIIMAIGWVVL